MKFLIPLFFISFGVLHAENVPLPTSVTGVDDIVSEFRGVLVSKLVDLGKNYISTIKDESLVFTNSESLNCNGASYAPGERLSTIQYNHKKINNQLIEKVIYTGCNSEISLVEEVITTGENVLPLKFADIILGKRTIDLADKESSRLYKISNGDGDEIFCILIEKKENQKIINFMFAGQRFLSMNFEYKPDQTRVVSTFYGYTATYIRKYSKWSTRSEFTPFTNTVIARKGEMVIYLDGSGNRLSQSSFINSFVQTIMEGPIKTIGSIFDYHTYYFPKTEATKTGSQNQHLIEELRVAQNRLLTNTDIILVKNQLQEYINAAELGQIIDNRPKN